MAERLVAQPAFQVTGFQWPVRVYWEDTDAGGIVFYANYLKFFERARTEWLRSLGIEQQHLKDSTGGMFVVSETNARYYCPARLDDALIVTARVLEMGRTSMIIKHQVLLKTEHKSVSSGLIEHASTSLLSSSLLAENSMELRLLCEGTIRIGWVQASNLQPCRIPAAVFERLKTC